MCTDKPEAWVPALTARTVARTVVVASNQEAALSGQGRGVMPDLQQCQTMF